MLRSLVGSEMCIRDRGIVVMGKVFFICHADLWIFYSFQNRLISALLRPCLLYTSDAADDLLCVDLGGRRIIKKKNIQVTLRARSQRYDYH